MEPTAAEQQGPLVQPKQLTTVPLPCAIEDINNSEMQAFFASGVWLGLGLGLGLGLALGLGLGLG